MVASEKAPALALPDKPSIAVLPFVNMSGDPEQEYFSDGMTEDLITDLSRLSGLFVIARNAVFTYKGQAIRPEQVGRELGVRYVVEGSVRKAGDRVRITAQLVEATTGNDRMCLSGLCETWCLIPTAPGSLTMAALLRRCGPVVSRTS